jgi:hypothetical protein
MAPDSKELSLVARRGLPGLRVMKSIQGSDSSTYLVPAPGLALPGFKLSIHPSGEIHVKSRDAGLIAQGDLNRLPDAFTDGTVDRLAASLLVRPMRQRALEGVIVPYHWLRRFGEWSGTEELRIDEFLTSVQPLELGDSRHLGPNLALLRRAGYLGPLDVVLLSDRRPESTLSFINVGFVPDIELPPISDLRSLPLWRSLTLALAQIRGYGGILVSIPEGRRLARLANQFGLGDVARGFSSFDQLLDQPGYRSEIEQRVRFLERDFVRPLATLNPRRPLRVSTLRQKKPWLRQRDLVISTV